jgi:hypothetical protein
MKKNERMKLKEKMKKKIKETKKNNEKKKRFTKKSFFLLLFLYHHNLSFYLYLFIIKSFEINYYRIFLFHL